MLLNLLTDQKNCKKCFCLQLHTLIIHALKKNPVCLIKIFKNVIAAFKLIKLKWLSIIYMVRPKDLGGSLVEKC